MLNQSHFQLNFSQIKMVPITFILYLSNFIFSEGFEAKNILPNYTPDILKYHFYNIQGSNFYFCEKKDAENTFKAFVNLATLVSSHVLTDDLDNNVIQIDMRQPQRIGIFLDLSCDNGYRFLEKNLDLFNSSYRWLIWTENYNETIDKLETSRIVIDSDVTLALHGVIFIDLYRVHPTTSMIITEIGTWSDDGVVDIAPIPLRKDFQGFQFNASLMMVDIKFNLSNLIPPLIDKAYESGSDMVRRYGLSLFLHMGEVYNFSMSYILTNAWGDPQPDGTWTGMVGQIKRGEADFGLAPAKYIVGRYAVIDFVTSLHIVRICFTFLQPKLFGTYKALILPLDPIVWVCLGVCSLLGVLAFRIVSKYDKTSLHNDSWGGSILLVLSSVAQQGFPDNTFKIPTRIIYLSLLLVTFFTATYYNTAILNGLLLQAPNAIQNIEQLLQSDVKLGILDISYFHNEMVTLNDSLTLRVRKKLEKIKAPKKTYYSVADGVMKIKKGQFALYTEDEALYTEIMHRMSDAEVCSLSEVEKYRPFHVGAVARDNSPYKETFNRVFTLMRESGIMDRQKNHWLVKKPECHWRQDALSLGLEPMSLAYFILGLGFILSVIAYVGERFIHEKEKDKLKTTKLINKTF